MDWLKHNPIADMPGPSFLLLYAVVIGIVLFACSLARRVAGRLGDGTPPRIPDDPDPYEIAYLRGGINELTRAVVFNLVQRGYLVAKEQKKGWGRTEQCLRHPSKAPDPRHLSKGEARAWEWFRTPRSGGEVFRADLPAQLQPYFPDYEARLRQQDLLAQETPAASGSIWLAGAAVIGGLGSYKLLVALEKGRHNVGFLILMGIAGLVVLAFLCFRSQRLTPRGKAYLQQLQLAFERLKSRPTRTAPGVMDPAPLLLVGVYGVGALAGGPYGYYHDMFRRSAASSSGGGCGSASGSCGSSCAGGGGCGGGGCGGCGGS